MKSQIDFTQISLSALDKESIEILQDVETALQAVTKREMSQNNTYLTTLFSNMPNYVKDMLVEELKKVRHARRIAARL